METRMKLKGSVINTIIVIGYNVVARFPFLKHIVTLIRPVFNRLFFNAKKWDYLRHLSSVRYQDCCVALIQAPSWSVNSPPLNLACLAAFLRQNDIRVMPVDLNVEMYHQNKERYPDAWDNNVHWFWSDPVSVGRFINDNKDALAQYLDVIIKSKVVVAGFTIYMNSYLVCRYLAKELKKRNKDIIIIFGGPGVTYEAEGRQIIKDNDFVDIIVRGEGEQTLLEVVEAVRRGNEVSCPGTIVRKGDMIVSFPARTPIRNVDALPYPDFSDFNFFQYREPYQCPIQSSRGCVNRCIFCNERSLWGGYRAKSGAAIYNEMKHQMEMYHHIAYFEFHDNLVNGNIRELNAMCDYIIADKRRYFWGGSAIVRKEMTHDFFLKLKRAGCTSLSFGVETTSKAVLKKVGKLFAIPVDIAALVRNSYKTGIGCVLNFMFGLPGETDEEAEANIRFIRRHAKYIKAVNPSPALCFIGPGTPAFEKPEKYGVNLGKGASYWDSTDGRNTFLRRLERFERFIAEVGRLRITSIYPHPVMFNRNEVIADYYFSTQRYKNAIPYYREALETESWSTAKEKKLHICYAKQGIMADGDL
jgi:radical SAM superfamily enzyme YgiQ (UPF0313 family)